MSDKINLLFPVEVMNREVDFRLFLACLCAQEDRRVWIGSPPMIYGVGTCARGGIYVGKNVLDLPRNVQLRRYHELKERDFRVIHLAEEGAVFRGDAEGWKRELRGRFDATCLAENDYVCTWGDFQRDFYKSFEPKCEANIRTTGHPRFDLYKPAYRAYFAPEASRLRQRYGDFVLIGSNLNRVNSYKGLERVFSDRQGYNVQDTPNRLRYFDRWQHLMNAWTHFIHLINRLSVEFPDLNVVIRPHPAENEATYGTIFAGVANIHIVREGSIGPWLLACKAMIHDGCTTGLEAHLAGVPIVSFQPVADPRHDAFLPNLFGARCSSNEEVVEHLHGLLKNKTFAQPVDATLPEDAYLLLDNFRHDCFPQLMAVIGEATSSIPSGRSLDPSLLRRAMQKDLRRHGDRIKSDIQQRKFYGFENIDLEQKLERIQTITRTRVKYTLRATNLLSVESA